MSVTVGIDLGTSFSSLAIYENGEPKIVPCKNQGDLLPSIVSYIQQGSEVGQAAAKRGEMYPENCIMVSKRLIGRQYDDPYVQDTKKNLRYVIDEDLQGNVIVRVNNGGQQQRYTPQQVGATIIKELLQNAEEYLGKKISKAIIGVPVYFNNIQGHATKQAGTIAGLNGVKLIKEPVAAALCYARQQYKKNNNSKEQTILIFDLGGGTFDVSVVKVQQDTANVQAHGGDADLGGEDFTQLLMNHVESKLQAQNVVLNRKDKYRLKAQCESAKRQLSTEQEVDIELLNVLRNCEDFCLTINRSTFENLCMDKFDYCLDLTKQVVQDANMSVRDIDDIVPVGGSSRIPKLVQLLKELFGRRIDISSVDLERAVAYGAALQAGSADNKNNCNVQDVTALSLGFGLNGDIMKVAIPRNTRYPVRRECETVSSVMDQTEIESTVLEGERPLKDGNMYLGKITLDGLPKMPKGDLELCTTFQLDQNGLLTVSMKNDQSGKSISVTIQQFSQHRSAADVQKHLEQAKLMQEEDKRNVCRSRTWVEVHGYAHEIENRLKYLDLKYESDSVKDKLSKISKDAIRWVHDNKNASEMRLNAKLVELQQQVDSALRKKTKLSKVFKAIRKSF